MNKIEPQAHTTFLVGWQMFVDAPTAGAAAGIARITMFSDTGTFLLRVKNQRTGTLHDITCLRPLKKPEQDNETFLLACFMSALAAFVLLMFSPWPQWGALPALLIGKFANQLVTLKKHDTPPL